LTNRPGLKNDDILELCNYRELSSSEEEKVAGDDSVEEFVPNISIAPMEL
jgi:hypothetical protein